VATDIAFIGRMRSGKDTAGARLVEHHGYTRLAFADPLKDAAMALDPWIVHNSEYAYEQYSERLSTVVGSLGWEGAKRYPEVRRILQQMGQGIRAMDPDFWVNRLVNSWYALGNAPVVVTDVRYRNEAAALKAHGFKLVRIVRPSVVASAQTIRMVGSGQVTARPLAEHASETELADYPVDAMIYNGGSLAELYQRVDALTQD
jgi:hypothetical protein